MIKAAVIVAGGSGTRYKSIKPKQFITINNKMIIEYSIQAFLPCVHHLIIVTPSPYHSLISNLYPNHPQIHICTSGNSRQTSVLYGLENLLDYHIDLVAIHDAVRPLVTNELIQEGFNLAELHSSAIPILPITDSLWKKNHNHITQSLMRDDFVFSQTPQTFNFQQIYHAHLSQKDQLSSFSDCASVFHKVFGALHTFRGNKYNIKLTYPEDLQYINFILNSNINEKNINNI